MVNVVNLWRAGEQAYIVQIGLLKCGSSSGKCGDQTNGVPNDGLVHFWFTKVDTAGGIIYDADSWYSWIPVFGNRYRMKISQVGGGVHMWEYCIRNLTTGQAYVCHTETIHWPNAAATAVGWFGEVQNTNAALGPSTGNQLDMYWLQYNKNNNTTWYVATDSTILYDNPTTPPYYWQEALYDVNYNDDGFRFWTADH